jgi:glucose/mannose-6-phosphate isomerase
LPTRLDDPAFVAKHDPKGMMRLCMGFPAQCREAFSIARDADLGQGLSGKPQVVVTGMGGSAAGGDFLKALFDSCSTASCVVVRDYDLPSFVGPNTLVIACSYSGNTEETLSATKQAIDRGCKLLAVTSGGEMAELSESQGFPRIIIPGGQPPRTALGYLFIPLVCASVALGYLPEQDFQGAFLELDRCAKEWGVDSKYTSNQTKTLAAYLFGRVPLLYGLGPWQGIVANRWKGQINENAKIMAFANVFPELNHNEIVGWGHADKQNAAHWATVFLESGLESTRMQTRARVTRDIIQHKAETFTVTSRGETLLSKLLTLTYFGDFVSLYLAALYETDPEEIESINRLKKELAALR